MSSIIIISHLFLFAFFLECNLAFLRINQTIFRQLQTNFEFIRCPLEFSSSWDIQWYDVNRQRYDQNRGRFYRIDTREENQRELICWSLSIDDHVKFFIRIYDRPLPIEQISIINITNTSLTVQWKDDPLNHLANIIAYELILKYDHLIQSRIRVNHSISMYTFSSLHSGIFYSIDISVIDRWKRSSLSKTILNQTFPFTSQKKIFFNQIIDDQKLDQSISCYYFPSQFLFIEFNSSTYHMLNHIYNLTIFNEDNRMITNRIVYSSLIFPLEEKQGKYTIELRVSTSQSEYLGKSVKKCRDFYPRYSPITCSMKFIERNQYHLIIHQHHRQIQSLHSNGIYYHVNQSYVRRIDISDIQHFVMEWIEQEMVNYSITMENNLLHEIFNVSILCSTLFDYRAKRFSYGIIISLILLFIILLISTWLITHRIKKNQRIFQSIPIDRFVSHVSRMHRKDHQGFYQLFQSIDDHTNETIDDYGQINGYIATQQPVIDTITKFWRMIWEKDVNVIVMMTNSNNRGNNQWWIYSSQTYEDFQITLNDVEVRPYYVKRIFTIRYRMDEKSSEDERQVYHFHFTNWPDDGVPDYPISFLQFIRVSSSCHSKMSGPMVVYSSTGMGPTGTYIVIDAMVKMMDKQRSLAIPSFLKHIRQQRYDLVRTKEEFIFIYDVLREAVEFHDGDLSKTEKQSQSFSEKIDPYLHGYHRIDEYLITKHPTMTTRNDFWKMIWDNQTEIIVALYAEENVPTGVFDYCPSTNQIIDCGDIHVCLLDERFQCEYIHRDCLIESTEVGEIQSRLFVRIISTSYWPETCSPIETSFDLIDTIRNLRTSKPIVVHDLLGGHRAATFCVLYTLKEQIEHQEVPNVYELAKFYSMKQPGIWRNTDDLLFLYRCARVLFQVQGCYTR